MWDDKKIKIVGKRETKTVAGIKAFEKINGFLKLVIALKNNNYYIPKGIYRFSSFEEKEQWRMKMLLGRKPVHLQ